MGALSWRPEGEGWWYNRLVITQGSKPEGAWVSCLVESEKAALGSGRF